MVIGADENEQNNLQLRLARYNGEIKSYWR